MVSISAIVERLTRLLAPFSGVSFAKGPIVDRIVSRLFRPPKDWGAEISSPITRLDSDLEAFSHNPSDGSFAPLLFQVSA
jgi:hypothetical protein